MTLLGSDFIAAYIIAGTLWVMIFARALPENIRPAIPGAIAAGMFLATMVALWPIAALAYAIAGRKSE